MRVRSIYSRGFTLVELPAVSRRRCRAFTLVELLVVIAIIGVLVALLLPAIQAAREAARRAQCKSQLKQIALACLNHENANHFLPSGGWWFQWMGDPNWGVGKTQCGGWIYAAAPYLEEANVTYLGKGLAAGSDPLREAILEQATHPIPVFYCPSRRPPEALPSGERAYNIRKLADGEKVRYAKTDYAINSGTSATDNPGPVTLAVCFALPQQGICRKYVRDTHSASHSRNNEGFYSRNGASAPCAEFELKRFTDGTAFTFLVGEKSIPVVYYQLGDGDQGSSGNGGQKGNDGDNNSMYQGWDHDNVRKSNGRPIPDPQTREDQANVHAFFGSAHPGGANMAFIDGSVHTFTYDVDEKLWSRLCKSDDGESVELPD